jgi:hypothetical protein
MTIFKLEQQKSDFNVTKKLIQKFENKIKNFPQLEIKTTHRFLNGMYSREVFMPKGSIVTSKTHNLENLTIISKGKCIEVSEEYEHRIIEAPYTMISPPGIKRALYILEDSVWTTVHYNPSNTQNLDELEQKIIKPEEPMLESEVIK